MESHFFLKWFKLVKIGFAIPCPVLSVYSTDVTSLSQASPLIIHVSYYNRHNILVGHIGCCVTITETNGVSFISSTIHFHISLATMFICSFGKNDSCVWHGMVVDHNHQAKSLRQDFTLTQGWRFEKSFLLYLIHLGKLGLVFQGVYRNQ